jgi:hypothetical protein
MTIIGCMAAYNEEQIIGPAIDSMFRIGCDRVIVVDGAWATFDEGNHYASADGTQEIAIAHGAEVIEAPGRRWKDQPEARSQYLVGEPGDWYLVCDADERCHGWLPDLTGEVEAYKVEVRGPCAWSADPFSHWGQMRLFKHTGERLRYEFRHSLVYADGVLIQPVVKCESYWLEHIGRDAEREAIKATYYEKQTATERAQPFVKRIPLNPLGAMTYIGGGAWMPGIPARNLTAAEAIRHHDLLVANLQGPRPLYVRQEQDDQPQQQSEPEDLPAKPRVRTQRRKEK